MILKFIKRYDECYLVKDDLNLNFYNAVKRESTIQCYVITDRDAAFDILRNQN